MCKYAPDVALRLEPRPESARKAREFIARASCEQHRAVVVDTACLLVSELVANAVRHGAPPIWVQLHCDDSHALQVRVKDGSVNSPTVQHVGADAEGGRGMTIVDLLSDAWGVEPGGDGKTVWFVIA